MERLRSLGGTAKLVFDVIQYPYLTSFYFKEPGCEGVYKEGQDPLHFFHYQSFGHINAMMWQLVAPIIFYTLQNYSNREGKWRDTMERILTRLQKLQILLFEFFLTFHL